VTSLAMIGASGRIGRAIAEEAVARGHEVRALVRAGGSGLPEGVTPVEVDLLDPLAVAAAVDGCAALISAFRPTDGDFASYRLVANSLVGAARALGSRAPRLVIVGGAGSLRHPAGGMLVEALPEDDERRPEMLGQVAALRRYRAVDDVDWAYASPSRTIEPGVRTGAYRLGGDDPLVGPDGLSRISYADYAVALVDEAETPRHVRTRFTVGY
jgi:putative NADH-flavin reductase